MIKSNFHLVLAEKRLRVADVARATKLSKTTLHKLYNEQSTRIDFETLDQLCTFLGCQVGDLLEHKEGDNS
jgi:putative transcriptional regulator